MWQERPWFLLRLRTHPAAFGGDIWGGVPSPQGCWGWGGDSDTSKGVGDRQYRGDLSVVGEEQSVAGVWAVPGQVVTAVGTRREEEEEEAGDVRGATSRAAEGPLERSSGCWAKPQRIRALCSS